MLLQGGRAAAAADPAPGRDRGAAGEDGGAVPGPHPAQLRGGDLVRPHQAAGGAWDTRGVLW